VDSNGLNQINQPTVISTFAGCGGSSLGYHFAGFKELLAVEWDDNAVATFKLNFPDVPVYHGDIAKLSSDECMQLAGIKKGELDVFDGSPPCQGFSTCGRRKMTDPRNSLFKEYARLINDLQPKIFVMENVTGMIKGYIKQAYLQIIQTLRDCGYSAKGQVMNAMYYNVPQSRERVIIIGVRNDLNVMPSHPKPQSKPMIVRDAIAGLIAQDAPLLSIELRKCASLMKPGNYSADNAMKAFQKIKGKTSGAINTKLLSWDRVSCTLVKSEIAGTGIIHPNKERYLSIDEMKRLASFPDNFVFPAELGRKNAVERIGNSVPPNLMRAIALHIKENILAKI
jgi:DNA (cytosine-5)-methyltransferase 1